MLDLGFEPQLRGVRWPVSIPRPLAYGPADAPPCVAATTKPKLT